MAFSLHFLPLPADWKQVLHPTLTAPWFEELLQLVDQERRHQVVYPPAADVFAAFQLTPFSQVRAVILGQDPYHGEGQAHGLCFSVRPGIPQPRSLQNILKEWHADLGLPIPEHGNLTAWARQGVLLLNPILTVREHAPLSHRGYGWERFTDSVISALNKREKPLVFLLWGGAARKKKAMIDTTRHAVLEAAHPSPLSAYRGFFGSCPFSRTNAELERLGQKQIDWRLPPSIAVPTVVLKESAAANPVRQPKS